MLQNRDICKFSKTSEKTAYLHKKGHQNPQQRSRCRYESRKKGQLDCKSLEQNVLTKKQFQVRQ